RPVPNYGLRFSRQPNAARLRNRRQQHRRSMDARACSASISPSAGCCIAAFITFNLNLIAPHSRKASGVSETGAAAATQLGFCLQIRRLPLLGEAATSLAHHRPEQKLRTQRCTLIWFAGAVSIGC